MFSYHLPDCGLQTCAYYTPAGAMKFEPPVYEQRYSTVCRVIDDPRWRRHFKKVVEFGCSEMRLLPLLRRNINLERILQVDIDGELLKNHQDRAAPLVADYIQKRENPLRVEIFRGCVTAAVENLRNTDVVLGVEIIEHLHPKELNGVPANIFGFIQPKLAILTTPNCEVNVLFGPLHSNGLRHDDHKFEWNRREFKEWAIGICSRYPNYSVSVLGVGRVPPEHRALGCVSQMAIFARKDILGKELSEPVDSAVPADTDPNVQYEEVFAVDFPYYRDERTKEEKIIDEVKHQLIVCRNVPRYYNRERRIQQIPLNTLIAYADSVGGSEAELRTILQENDIQFEGDFIILPEGDDCDEEDRCAYRYDDLYDPTVGDEVLGAAGVDADQVTELNSAHDDVTSESEETWDLTE